MYEAKLRVKRTHKEGVKTIKSMQNQPYKDLSFKNPRTNRVELHIETRSQPMNKKTLRK